MRAILLVSLAIFAFAGNSLLTRFALQGSLASPVAFAGIRLVSGGITLALLSLRSPAAIVPGRQDLVGIVSLFTYAAAFSTAYLSLSAATGALILFGTVQLTMAGLAIQSGTWPKGREAMGLLVAFSGLVWLLLPGLVSPPLRAAFLMVLAGIAWGFYTMAGRIGGPPVPRTARNFIGASILGLVWILIEQPGVPGLSGWTLAIASGAITSGLGYAIWYMALPEISSFTAGAAQLLVPVIASLGGLLWLHEQISVKLLLVSVIVLGGISLTLKRRNS